MKWVDQSLKVNENINNLYLKARIQAAAGNKAEATKTARAAMAKATDKDKEEVGEIEKSMSNWQGFCSLSRARRLVGWERGIKTNIDRDV